jgi:hypothetical protein
MAQVIYRGNLSAKSFPFLSYNFGRTVIVPGQDQNYVRTAFSTEDLDKDKGIPQIYYCHNMMPHQEGLQAVGYKQILPVAPAGATGFSQVFLLRDFADNKAYLGVVSTPTTNDTYICDGVGGPWVFKQHGAPGLVTVAYISGLAYFFIEGYGCYYYDFTSTYFEPVTLTGLAIANITGICAAAGYLIAWTKGVKAVSFTATVSVGDTTLSIGGITGFAVGQVINGTGIPVSTTIAAVDYTTHLITISQAVTAAGISVLFSCDPLPSSVLWSSAIDPTDFTPSLVTGAGGGPVEAAKGVINYCVPHTLGFIIGTADNCIAALYQNNSQYPFQFRELVNSGGMTTLDLVTWDANSAGLYAYTTSGLQLINTQQTQTVYTEITDFISGTNFEDFDDVNKVFIRQELTGPMQKKLAVVADRYLVMSYGVNSLTHAIVLDLITKRYGKLKIDHTQCFTVHFPGELNLEVPRQTFAFLKTDGSVYTVDFDIASLGLDGTLILGKFQYVRARLMTLDQISMESVKTGQVMDLTVMTSLDGKTTTNSTPDLIGTYDIAREYGCRATGINHSLLFQGAFMLNSLVLTFNIHGKR